MTSAPAGITHPTEIARTLEAVAMNLTSATIEGDWQGAHKLTQDAINLAATLHAAITYTVIDELERERNR